MLNKQDEPDTLRLLVIFLRYYAHMTQTEFGKAASVEQALVSRYESGQQPPPDEALRRMAKVTGIPWPLVMHLRRLFSAVLRLSAHPESETDPNVGSLDRLMDRVLLAMSPHLIETVDALLVRRPPEEMRREAAEVWTNLRDHPMSHRRRLLDFSIDTARSWALAERLCDASLETADPRESLDLADLALSIAQDMEGEEAWRSRVKGYCWAHISHARRSANDAAGARSAAARAWDLWEAGEFADCGLLSESRMFELLGDVAMP
jgi:transcriptional regulator with XRE-family HTH domain